MARDEQRAIVGRTTILRGTVGSSLHGLHPGGQDDRDEMGIFVEPPEFALGLRLARSGSSWNRFDHFVELTQPEGARSGPGDLDASPLRFDPDYEAVDAFIVASYRDAWGW